MATVITPRNGVLIAIRPKTGATPGILTIDGLKDASADILVTSFSQQAAVVHQLTQTIGGPEYLFVFGDMLQEISVGIVVSAKACAGVSSYLSSWKFYEDKKITPRRMTTLSMVFGGVSLRGILIGFAARTDAGSGYGLVQGTLQLKGWYVTEANGTTGNGNNGDTTGRPTPASGAISAAAASAQQAMQSSTNGKPTSPLPK